MLAEKLFIGERLDFQHYKGLAVTDYEVEVLDIDGDPYSFADYLSLHYELFAKPHGLSLGITDLAVPADNIILLNIPSSVFDIRETIYYYEVYGYTDASPSEKVIIHYGYQDLTP